LAPPALSVVVAALNEGRNLRHTIDCLQSSLPAGSEIMVVDDGSEDGCSDFLGSRASVRLVRSDHLGVAKARNLGAALSRGRTIVFADAHIRVEAGWWRPLVEVLRQPKVGAVAPAISNIHQPQDKGFGLRFQGAELSVEWLEQQGSKPYPVPLLPGCCWAMRRKVFQATGGFDSGLISWGSTDNEMSLRLWLLGYELWLAPQAEAAHLFREEPPYALENSAVLHNILRLAFVHFGERRIAQVVDAFRTQDAFPVALAEVLRGDVSERRRELASRRLYDDDWFFRRFGPDW